MPSPVFTDELGVYSKLWLRDFENMIVILLVIRVTLKLSQRKAKLGKSKANTLSWSILIWNTAIIASLCDLKTTTDSPCWSVQLLWTGEGIWRDCQHYEYIYIYIYMWLYSHWYSPWYSHYWWSISHSYPMNTYPHGKLTYSWFVFHI